MPAPRRARLAAVIVLTLATAAAPWIATLGHTAVRNLRLQGLVAAEREFSARSVGKGMKDAFLAYLAEDGVLFRPTPTNGKRAWEARENPKGTLTWEPTFAEVSHAGDLGVDSGPWEYRLPGEPAPPPLYGHFVSVWKRTPPGPWKVVVDLGVSHAKPDTGGLGGGNVVEGPYHDKLTSGSTLDLRKLDGEYSDATRQKGIGSAFAAIAAPDVRLHREGWQPIVGLKAARAEMDSFPGSLRFLTQGNRLAVSRDLGYSYGIAERFDNPDQPASDSLVYLHVWRQNPDRSWRLSLAVLNPLPRTGRK
jgi:ketosteroid isomerase-like protein